MFILNHLNLWAENVKPNQDFPIRAVFDFRAKKPDVAGHAVLTGRALAQIDKKEYFLNQMMLKADLQIGEQQAKLKLAGSLSAEVSQGLYRALDLVGSLASMPVSGQMRILKNQELNVSGIFKWGPFNLKTFLKEVGVKNDAVQSADGVAGVLNMVGDASGIDITGSVTAPKVQWAHVAMQNVLLPFHYRNGVLDIEAGKSNMYQGKALVKAIAKFQMKPQQFAAQLGLSGVQIAPLLYDLNPTAKLSIAGVGNAALLVSTNGVTFQGALTHLNGSLRFEVKDGKLLGIDIPYFLDSAMALADKRVTPQLQGDTFFSTLTGSALIHDGILTNNDLQLNAARFTLKGKGSINLPEYSLNYALEAQLKKTAVEQKDNLVNLYGLPIPVIISGKLDDPRIRLDSATFLKALAQQQVRKVADQLLNKQIKNQIPRDAGRVLDQLLSH